MDILYSPSTLVHIIWWGTWFLSLLTVPSVLVQRAARPAGALSWILLLFFLPPIALPIWWLIGHTHLKVKSKRRRRAKSVLEPALEKCYMEGPLPKHPSQALLNVLTLPDELNTGIFPPSAGNRAVLLEDVPSAYNAWENSLHKAKQHIHLLFYAWRADATGRRFRDILIQKAQQGVQVRLLLDWVGTSAPLSFFNPLKAAGGRVAWFMPPKMVRQSFINFRNHRKLIIIDGCVSFIGGMNIGGEYLSWLDLAVKLQGPVVDQIQEVFCDDWYFSAGEEINTPEYFGNWSDPKVIKNAHEYDMDNISCATISSGPHQQLNATQEVLFLALTSARKRIWIMTPYFIPDQAIIFALRAARYRGVDVKLMLPALSNHPIVRRASRAYYAELLQTNINILEYLGMVHAKVLIIDDHITFMGSANVDSRSFRLNFETTTICDAAILNTRLAAVFENASNRCRPISPADFTNLSWYTRVIDASMHLLSPLL
jgi:cardiolipin synthase